MKQSPRNEKKPAPTGAGRVEQTVQRGPSQEAEASRHRPGIDRQLENAATQGHQFGQANVYPPVPVQPAAAAAPPVPAPGGAGAASSAAPAARSGPGLENMPHGVMASIIDMLSPQDVGAASSVSRGWRARFQQAGHQFMAPVYNQPETAVPRLMPSVDAWARGEGPPADPQARSELLYKMAGLDPASHLETRLGEGSLANVPYVRGGGFIAHRIEPGKPGQTEEEARRAHEARLATYNARKAKGEKVDPQEPQYKPPKAPEGPKQTGHALEYHPGGGTHSGRVVKDEVQVKPGVPSTRSMGGSYFKVEKPGGKGKNYRFSRYGPFKSAQVTGHFWDPLGPGQPGAAGPTGLSAETLVREGAQAEGAGEATAPFEQEARARYLRARTGPSRSASTSSSSTSSPGQPPRIEREGDDDDSESSSPKLLEKKKK